MEEKPAAILAKSSSRDARVSCETLSNAENRGKQQQFAATLDKNNGGRGDGCDSGEATPHGHEMKARGGSKGLHVSGHLFACFPPSPKNATYILSKPLMSPGRDGRRGADFGARARPHPGPGSLSFSGSSPRSGSMKPIISLYSSSLKGHSASSRGHSPSFTMIPAEVVGKKHPPGYESDEPTSPEVTCIGRVKIKQKNWKASRPVSKETSNRGKLVKGASSVESPREEKHSRWKQVLAGKGAAASREAANFESCGEIDLHRFGSVCELSTAGTGDGKLLDEGGEAAVDEARRGGEEEEAEIPPPNSLLLMKLGSRSSERLRYEPQERRLAARGSSYERPASPAGDLPEAATSGSLWERRAVAQPMSLNVKPTGAILKLEVRKPSTR